MDFSLRGLIEIAEHEGIVPAPYRDSAGVWTWGIGHTAAAGGPDPVKMPRAMPQDIEAAVMAAINQFAIDTKAMWRGSMKRSGAARPAPVRRAGLLRLQYRRDLPRQAHRRHQRRRTGSSPPFHGLAQAARDPKAQDGRDGAVPDRGLCGQRRCGPDLAHRWQGQAHRVLGTMSGAELLQRIAVAPVPRTCRRWSTLRRPSLPLQAPGPRRMRPNWPSLNSRRCSLPETRRTPAAQSHHSRPKGHHHGPRDPASPHHAVPRSSPSSLPMASGSGMPAQGRSPFRSTALPRSCRDWRTSRNARVVAVGEQEDILNNLKNLCVTQPVTLNLYGPTSYSHTPTSS